MYEVGTSCGHGYVATKVSLFESYQDVRKRKSGKITVDKILEELFGTQLLNQYHCGKT